MLNPTFSHNERSWSGQIIAWLKAEIAAGHTEFEDANNDASLITEGNKTLYPDILLFSKKATGVVFNGWELKYPDTPVDDRAMLLNALIKAKALQSNSFVTWNGAAAIIWGIADEDYTLAGLSKLKIFEHEPDIRTRNDLKEDVSYKRHEPKLQERLKQILAELGTLRKNGKLHDAISISDELTTAIGDAGRYVIREVETCIIDAIGGNRTFSENFEIWKLLEGSTLKILASAGSATPINVLARFIFYKLIGKIIFYLTLQRNLPGKLKSIELNGTSDVVGQLDSYFNLARQIDYQAVFDEADFTDAIQFSQVIDTSLTKLVATLTKYEFRILPTEVIGDILEKIVPRGERQQFGQYFSPETLAYLVAYPVIGSYDDVVFDPTAGTGTFLTVFYNILKSRQPKSHSALLEQVWGNDISHFPAILSVINLYKLHVDSIGSGNFPRVIRSDFFALKPGDVRKFPDNSDSSIIRDVAVPVFDAIASNFPFVEQAKAVTDGLTTHFNNQFGTTQAAFLETGTFAFKKRADYYTYCFYQSLQFLKPGTGQLAAITSNAWLGKNYGVQLKRFLLDNFHIRYVVKSEAGSWFENAQVNTIYVVVQRELSTAPTRFVTIREPLAAFTGSTAAETIAKVADFYASVRLCDHPAATDWIADPAYPTSYEHRTRPLRVSLLAPERLRETLSTAENWESFFWAADVLTVFARALVPLNQALASVKRGLKMDFDGMYLLKEAQAQALGIEREFLVPALHDSDPLVQIHHTAPVDTYFFVCPYPLEVLEARYPGAYAWVQSWGSRRKENGKLYADAHHKTRRPWYALNLPQAAPIYITMAPYKRLFFSYSATPHPLNQRLVALRPALAADTELCAALLNSIVTLIGVERSGNARSQGALDLNGDYFRTRIKMLNPALLTAKGRADILAAFAPLTARPIPDYDQEFARADRLHFDKTVLQAFGFDPALVAPLYKILTDQITDRVTLKDK